MIAYSFLDSATPISEAPGAELAFMTIAKLFSPSLAEIFPVKVATQRVFGFFRLSLTGVKSSFDRDAR
ncbi:hypothetical protein LYNGBM3L_55260 [Moorena producens 3L]|uniref:Uncharacterized protein n=1 Tax=Moorena producens 3L TaxID=489825 RepID=F4XR66_9CYAN|nr:hypothetical protein LYNGBM3L_55260 [Moorena producens 3L]